MYFSPQGESSMFLDGWSTVNQILRKTHSNPTVQKLVKSETQDSPDS